MESVHTGYVLFGGLSSPDFKNSNREPETDERFWVPEFFSSILSNVEKVEEFNSTIIFQIQAKGERCRQKIGGHTAVSDWRWSSIQPCSL